MTTTKTDITVHRLFHKRRDVIGLRFDFDQDIIRKIKTIRGRRYSATNKCWYIPYTAEAYADFRKLGLPYRIEKSNTSKVSLRGHTQDSLPDKYQSANEDNNPRISDHVGLREDEPTSDIFRAVAGKIVIQYCKKYFYLSLPYDEMMVNKIKKIHRVWWNKKLQKWIAYCAQFKPVYYLFESTKIGKAYSAKSVQNVVKAAAKRANISQKVTPHVLRHCFATHLLDGGINIRLIQELLGHKDIKTTLIYTYVSTSQLTAVTSPLDKLNQKSEL